VPKLIIFILLLLQISCTGVGSFIISAAGNMTGDFLSNKIEKLEKPKDPPVIEANDENG
jgi:hypothetical protein